MTNDPNRAPIPIGGLLLFLRFLKLQHHYRPPPMPRGNGVVAEWRDDDDGSGANIASGCAPKASGLFRSGCPTYVPGNSWRKPTASRLPSPPASTRLTTKHSSTPSPSTGPPSEARRHLHRCCTRYLHWQAEARRHRSGRSVRCNCLDHGLSVDNQSPRRTSDPGLCRGHGVLRDRAAKPDHDRQDHDDAAGERARPSRASRRRRSHPARPRTPCISRACRMTMT